jgi:Fur family peroxide stress response transcriptional regulator
MDSFEKTIKKLRSEGFKLTPQRLAVIKFLMGNCNHPTAREIHKELKRKYPSLSFSTVYNTLNMLEGIEEIQSLNVCDDHLNYDPNMTPHIHFCCTKCGTIRDVFTEDKETIRIPEQEIEGHRIDSYQVVFKGTCLDCR